VITEDETGEPLSIGRKSRSIPPSIHRADGQLVFKDQQGKVLAESFNLTAISTDQTTIESLQSRLPNLEIDAETCVPMTRAGDHMDWHLAVGHLFA